MERIALTAPDISCNHCKETIERELSILSGAKTVSVDVPSKHVNVSFDPAQASEATIIAKLAEEGYPVTA